MCEGTHDAGEVPEGSLKLLPLKTEEHDGQNGIHLNLAHPLLPQDPGGLCHTTGTPRT